jgi:ubiquinone/menaquinone biosynthesis C-methylase UbiE
MDKQAIGTQYSAMHDVHSQFIHQDERSNPVFHALIDVDLAGKRLLDVGCGDGTDLAMLAARGAIPHGLDPSVQFLQKAQEKMPSGTFREGVGERMPFDAASFDVVVSKWAMQTSTDVPGVLREAARVLRPGGLFVFLTKHPWMQWMEKVRDHGAGADYYQQMVVTSNIYGGTIVLREPSHTLGEYFDAAFLASFDVIDFREGTDFPASEQIGGQVYPTFLAMKARRR